MNLSLADKIAKAVLYEGYLLYPYRPTAVKNKQRWNFGALYPESFCNPASSDSDSMQTECLAEASEDSVLEVRVRFLHLRQRQVETEQGTVPLLEVNGVLHQTWEEAVERDVPLPALGVGAILHRPFVFNFSFASSEEIEELKELNGNVAGLVRRMQKTIRGRVEVAAQQVADGLVKIHVCVKNTGTFVQSEHRSEERTAALMHSLVSTHSVLSIQNGSFLSSLNPPEKYSAFSTGLKNIGTWPVLVGEEGEHDLMLSSPIILYDYPQVAAESAGDLFDSTEIDEILSLRILTLTEEEKREMRDLDEHSRRILERTESMPEEQWLKMHGVLRRLRSTSPGTES